MKTITALMLTLASFSSFAAERVTGYMSRTLNGAVLIEYPAMRPFGSQFLNFNERASLAGICRLFGFQEAVGPSKITSIHAPGAFDASVLVDDEGIYTGLNRRGGLNTNSVITSVICHGPVTWGDWHQLPAPEYNRFTRGERGEDEPVTLYRPRLAGSYTAPYINGDSDGLGVCRALGFVTYLPDTMTVRNDEVVPSARINVHGYFESYNHYCRGVNTNSVIESITCQ